MSYQWQPLVRITPDNGAVETIDLRTGMTYLGRPVKCAPKWTPATEMREDVNRSARVRVDGVRIDVEFDFDIGGTSMADHEVLSRIVNTLLAQSALVELSLDNGATYREVVLLKYTGPDPFRGKTIAGARFQLDLRCVDLVDEVAPIRSGSW